MEIKCAYTELVPIEKIKLNPKNRNKHSDEQIQRLVKLMDYYGIRHPVVIDRKTGLCAAGEGRYMAMKSAGVTHVPVDYQEFLSSEQMQQFSIADNEIARWADPDMEGIETDLSEFAVDFDDDLLGIYGFERKEEKEFFSDEDDIPEDVKPVCKRGQIWQLGEHRLLCGDATSEEDVNKLMDGQKADMVFTDPPYGMSAVSKSGVLSKNYHKDIMNDDSTDVAKETFDCIQSLQIEKQVFWGANYYSSALPDATCWLVWNKNNGQSDQMDAELAWTNFSGVTRMFTQASEKVNRVHPTQKPVSLAQWCLERWEAKSVLDIFGGSGSTLIACEKTGRKCFMMEIDPHYCDVIIKRWEDFTGNSAKLLAGPTD
jgi:DNA modification methylase